MRLFTEALIKENIGEPQSPDILLEEMFRQLNFDPPTLIEKEKMLNW